MALRKAQSILNLSHDDMGTAMYSTAFELLFFKRDIAHMDPENLKKVQQHMEKISSKVDINKLKKNKWLELLHAWLLKELFGED